MTKSLRGRITDLEGELKQRDDRVKELAKERDEERIECAKLREKLEEAHENINEWVEIFHSWEEGFNDTIVMWREMDEEADGYAELKRRWNRLVAEHTTLMDLVDERRLNGTLAKRERGRQIAATPEQRMSVFCLHDEGVSLREIANEVGIGFQTVRTLIGKINGTDRASRKLMGRRAFHEVINKRIKISRKDNASYRARKRVRDAWPKRLDQQRNRSEALLKASTKS
jgi:hypothetical protein